jgi:DNA-binding protein H-NS
MAKRAITSQDETLDLYGEVSEADRLRDIENLFDGLTVAQLQTVRKLAATKRKEKLEEAKETVLREMKGQCEALGLTLKEVFPSLQEPTKPPVLPVKYRSPTGETWRGRGQTPTWLRILEEAGHNREEFRVIEG